METHALCSMCIQQGRVICYCKGLPQVFCTSCYSGHSLSNPNSLHMTNPIEQPTGPKRVPEYAMCFCGSNSQKSCRFCKFSLDNKRRRIFDSQEYPSEDIQHVADKILEEMQKNLAKLYELKANLNSAKEALYKRVEEVVIGVQFKIQLIEMRIQEISDGLHSAKAWESIDDSIYSHWLIKDCINSPKLGIGFSVNLFNYEFFLETALSSIDKFCHFELTPLPSPSICYFKPKSNFCFNFTLSSQQLSKTATNTSEQFRQGAAWCQIAEQKYLYCGGEGRGITNSVTLINPSEGSIYAMPSMNATRSYHAIVYYEKAVYVFGGQSPQGRLKSAEKYDFERSQWIYLPNMLNARSHFTACSLKHKIYLAGGCGSGILEMFDPVELNFVKIPITLPFQSYWTMTANCSNHLMIFQGNTLLKVEYEESWKTNKTPIENSGGWWSEMPPVFFKDTLYFFRKNTIMIYESKLGAVKELISI